MAFYKRCYWQGFTFTINRKVKCVCDLTGDTVLKSDCRRKECYTPNPSSDHRDRSKEPSRSN